VTPLTFESGPALYESSSLPYLLHYRKLLQNCRRVWNLSKKH